MGRPRLTGIRESRDIAAESCTPGIEHPPISLYLPNRIHSRHRQCLRRLHMQDAWKMRRYLGFGLWYDNFVI